jgi:hypothetical protein
MMVARRVIDGAEGFGDPKKYSELFSDQIHGNDSVTVCELQLSLLDRRTDEWLATIGLVDAPLRKPIHQSAPATFNNLRHKACSEP